MTLLGRILQGRTLSSLGEDSLGEHSPGEDSPGKDAFGQDSSGEDCSGEDSSGENSTGGNSPRDDSLGEDSSGGDSSRRDSSGQDRKNRRLYATYAGLGMNKLRLQEIQNSKRGPHTKCACGEGPGIRFGMRCLRLAKAKRKKPQNLYHLCCVRKYRSLFCFI